MGGCVRILAIDGGGIRGVIPARVLAEVERRTGQRAAQLFDVMAGTSTGGLLALGLAVPDSDGLPRYSARDLVGLYESQGELIFSRSVWHAMRALGNLVDERYPRHGIDSVLDVYLGRTRLREALTDVLVLAYDLRQRQPAVLTSWGDGALCMRDAARATTAAPTYFEPVCLDDDGRRRVLIDGGVYANNPALCALVEARLRYPQADDFVLVSLGTGELTRPYCYEDVCGWGLAAWARPLLDVMFDGVADLTGDLLQRLLAAEATAQRYYRFQTTLTEGNDDMDDASRTNLRVLNLLADDLIGQHSADLDRLSETLLGASQLWTTRAGRQEPLTG